MPAAWAPRQGAHAPAPPPGPEFAPLPARVFGPPLQSQLWKKFFFETWAWRSPAQCFLIWGAFPENVAKKLSQRAEEHAFSGRVKTNHRLPVFLFLSEVGVPCAPPHG